MNTTHDSGTDAARAGLNHSESAADDALPSAVAATEGWVPDDRAPSAAESNFMSVALFAFLIFFGIGCLIFF